jgi:hypothetical protein
MTSLYDRTGGLAVRMGERPRDRQQVTVILVDGTEIRGVLHRAQGTRTLDYLNCQAEGFVAMTDALLIHNEQAERISFIAINKTHIIRVTEGADVD